jgi:GntR family transcriptional regulator
MPAEPEYQRIARVLRQRIESGELQPGDTLPTIDSIRLEAGVSTTTVRAALTLLREQGFVRSLRGGRYTVRDREAEDRLAELERRVADHEQRLRALEDHD